LDQSRTVGFKLIFFIIVHVEKRETKNDQVDCPRWVRLSDRNIGASNDASAACSAGPHDHASPYGLWPCDLAHHPSLRRIPSHDIAHARCILLRARKDALDTLIALRDKRHFSIDIENTSLPRRLQERLRSISTGLGVGIPNDGFRVLAADNTENGLSIGSEEGQRALDPLLSSFDLVIFDNLSTLHQRKRECQRLSVAIACFDLF
jgi:hypothetical protein